MILRAAWVVPVSSPPIRNGAVEIRDGLIARIGAADDMAPATNEFAEDLGDVAILPGLINAHTHLELTNYAERLDPAPLWDWIAALIALRRAPGAAEIERDAVMRGARLSLAGGATCVADISRTGDAFDVLLSSPVRKVCFLELISGASMPPANAAQLRAAAGEWMRRIGDRSDARVGVSPHAPFTVNRDDLRGAADVARELDLPMTMHLAETREETEWLANRSGALATFLSRLGGRAESGMPGGAIRDVLADLNPLITRPILAHANHADAAAIAAIAGSGCSVAFCPRAHAWFGHVDHPWRAMRAAGVNVCLGTDSLASNSSLSMLDEVRFLRRAAPDVAPHDLLEMATRNAARALRWDDVIGDLSPGKAADLIAVPMESSQRARVVSLSSNDAAPVDPVAAVLDGASPVSSVWINGVAVPHGSR
jgi:cytosine/adenosine deaminase-related metal-dependent hydrolase